jgi:hypothetical protein
MNDTVNTENAATAATAAGIAQATEAVEKAKRAAASNFLPIVRGRLPLIFVHAVRFDKVLNSMGNKDLAAKFGTSVGKIFDIKKGRNFAYVTEGFKPTGEDVAAAKTWINQVGAANAKGLNATGDKTLMQTTLDAYEARGLATAEDAAAFAAAKAKAKEGGAEPAVASGASGASGASATPKAPKAPKAKPAQAPSGAGANLLA